MKEYNIAKIKLNPHKAIAAQPNGGLTECQGGTVDWLPGIDW